MSTESCDASSDVLVVGGGIGGLTAALSLARSGRRVRVLERAAEYGEIGAGIQLAPNATRVLQRLGVLARLCEVGVLPRRLVLADALTDEELTHLPLGDFPERYGAPYVLVHRHDLSSELLRACEDAGVALERSAHVVGATTQTEQRVQATCVDGRQFDAELLVAADGLRSTLRALVVDDAPICSGYAAYRGTIPVEAAKHQSDLRDVVAWIGPGLHLVRYALRAGDLYNLVAVFRSRRFEHGRADWGLPDELDAAFADVSAQVASSVQIVGRDQWWPMYDRRPIDTWVRGRMVLLGDAAHPMLQYLAQGACQAIIDADALVHSLDQDPTNVEAALGVYQRRRSAIAGRVQSAARQWGDFWHLDGASRIARNQLLRERNPNDHTHVEWLYGNPGA